MVSEHCEISVHSRLSLIKSIQTLYLATNLTLTLGQRNLALLSECAATANFCGATPMR